MTEKTFELKLLGVTPDKLDVEEVLSYLKAYRDALVAITCHDSEASLPKGPAVSLVGIKKGSSRFQLRIARRIQPAMPTVARAVLSGAFEEIPSQARRALKTIIASLKENGRSLELPAYRGKTPVLSGTTAISERPSESYSSRTTLYGRIYLVGGGRVGSEFGRAELKLGDGNAVKLKGDRSLIKQIATSLYDEVGVEGTASWDAMTNIPFEMHVDRHIELPNGDARTAFNRLANAAGDHWDNIDVADYVAELRSDN